MAITQLSDLILRSLVPSGGFHQSPAAWEDHVFYFLLVDRFSNDKEKSYRDIAGNVVTSGTIPSLYTGTEPERHQK